MPIYEYLCSKCNYKSEKFVWHSSGDKIICPSCGTEMLRLFTTSNMPLLNRQKPMGFKYDPKEMNADKDIWKTVITDTESGKTTKAEIKWWKKEIEKNNPNLIL